MVQPHGWLLVLDPATLDVIRASANLDGLTGVPTADSIGRPLSSILGTAAASALRRAMDQAESEPPETGMIAMIDCRIQSPLRIFEGWLQAHWSRAGVILELEPAQQESVAPLLAGLSTAIRRYRAAADPVALGRVLAADVRAATGFDRALVMGFGADGEPEILAEDAAPEGAPPTVLVVDALPTQARTYLETNRTRMVPDLQAPGIPIVPGDAPVDLARSALRAPSAQLHGVGRRYGLRSVMILSMIQAGRVRGVVVAYGTRPLTPPPAARAYCEALTEIAAGQMAALDERTAAAARMAATRALAHLSQGIRSAEDLGDAVSERHWDIVTLFGVDGWRLSLDGEERTGGDFPPEAAWRPLLEGPDAHIRDGVAWSVRRDAGTDPMAVLRLEIGAAGSLVLVRRDALSWTPAALDAAQELHRVLADRNGELVRSRMERRLHRLAYYDPVTDLPNRGHLTQEIQRAMSAGEDPAVLVVSLHRFKTLKGSLGDEPFNKLLVAVAKRLESCLGPGDRLSRIDTGEFGVLLPGSRGAEAAAALQSAIRDVLRTPVSVDRREVFVTANLGVVPSAQAHGLASEVLRNAEIAALEAEAGGGGSKAFEVAMRARLTDRYDLYDRLRQAVYFGGGVGVAFQPIVDLTTGDLVGFEALARWTDPERGIVPPAEFIPIAEETGLIIPLGNGVMMQAARQIALWNRDRRDRPLHMSVNLSPYQIDPDKLDLERWVRGVLDITGAEPSWIKLEITESGLVSNAAATIDVLRRVRQLGVGIGIDDFGTGYSSLSYLQRLPVQTIKIDQSFMAQLGQDGPAAARLETGTASEGVEVVRTIIQLARTLGYDVVAEGVDSVSHIDILRALGCGLGQGFLFARPLSTDEAGHIVRGERPWARACGAPHPTAPLATGADAAD